MREIFSSETRLSWVLAAVAGLIGAAGHAGRHEAAYFGWWNWGVQMSLALAAGIALPLLGWLGYVPGGGGGLPALSAAWALLGQPAGAVAGAGHVDEWLRRALQAFDESRLPRGPQSSPHRTT